jgi:hypothetical protein
MIASTDKMDENTFRSGIEVICGSLPPRYREYAEQYRDHLLYRSAAPEEFNLIHCQSVRTLVDAFYTICQMHLKDQLENAGSLTCPLCCGLGRL